MQKIISFILAEVPRLKGGEVLAVPQSESAPHYFGASVPKQVFIAQEEHDIQGKKVTFEIKAYLPDILLVEGQMEVEDVFGERAFETRERLIEQCHAIVKQRGGKFDMSEEYSVAVVAGYVGDPEQFFKYAARIAGFLKSEKLPLDEKEVAYTLSAQMKYAKDDLVIVDWDGAFIFDPGGEYESIVELMQIANLQLLRYRVLDVDLDRRLRKVGKFIQASAGKVTVFKSRELAQAFGDVIAVRSRSIAEFEGIDREIKLIGEWYSARLYDFIGKKFKLDTWKADIKEKLDSLEDVYSIVAENFSITRHQLLELIQIILFFVLQAGWFGLIILEFLYFTR
ncbi:MAG: hypothetical protein HYT82_03005 [Candidatus Harrisonbacteria bacterium]|nr:hypothetical protein [Candidatus Harrisonbacteria bacterium]MBI2406531.1 hypothetical protein [Candidatus Harrisonbacteria bacterium]